MFLLFPEICYQSRWRKKTDGELADLKMAVRTEFAVILQSTFSIITVVMLAAFSGRPKALVWCPSVICLLVPSFFLM